MSKGHTLGGCSSHIRPTDVVGLLVSRPSTPAAVVVVVVVVVVDFSHESGQFCGWSVSLVQMSKSRHSHLLVFVIVVVVSCENNGLRLMMSVPSLQQSEQKWPQTGQSTGAFSARRALLYPAWHMLKLTRLNG